MGLPVVPRVEIRPGRVLPMFRWGFVLSSESKYLPQTTHLPFGESVYSLISLFTANETLEAVHLR
jgi:hypothetical protein